MIKRSLLLIVLMCGLTSCASWFSSSSNTPDADNPTVGSKDGSNQLFDTGPNASAPVSSSGSNASAPVSN